MATAGDKNRCVICKKERATLRCGGCSQDFCFNHVAEHRQELCKELDEVEVSRDLFRQALTEQTFQPKTHPLLEQIDRWEQESINKVQQAANEARQLLVHYNTEHFTEIDSQLNKLTNELRKSREENDFYETDLARWKKEIARLSEALNVPSTMHIRQNSTSLVTKIVVDVGTVDKAKHGRQTSDTYSEANDRRDATTRTNNNSQSSRRSIVEDSASITRLQSHASFPSTKDKNENNHSSSRRSIPPARSTTSLPQLRATFEDSDDDNRRSLSWNREDMTEYRNNYPNARYNPMMTDNFRFHTNQIPSHPDGDFIDEIHRKWFGDYEKLESHDSYIHWLFPLQDGGSNRLVEPLQKHEIESIKNDPNALKRILRSYQLMLDFYGFQLFDNGTGRIRRLNGDTYRARFRNLNTSPHNYPRITRILKCLGEFNYEHLKFPFLEALLRECITENTLGNCLLVCKDNWIETLRSGAERRAIRRFARKLIEYRNQGIQPPNSYQAQRATVVDRMAISDDEEN